MSRHRFLLAGAELDAATVELRGAELAHMRARRLRSGEIVEVSDGAGRRRDAVVARIDDEVGVLRFVAEVRRTAASSRRFVLVQAILKGERLDWVVEKAAELGVERIVPFRGERTVADISAARLARLRRLAAAACEQSHAALVTQVDEPVDLLGALARTRACRAIVFWEESSVPFAGVVSALADDVEPIAVWIGPEGGLSAREVDVIVAAGGMAASLGARPLRADTAAVVGLAICRQMLLGSIAGDDEAEDGDGI